MTSRRSARRPFSRVISSAISQTRPVRVPGCGRPRTIGRSECRIQHVYLRNVETPSYSIQIDKRETILLRCFRAASLQRPTSRFGYRDRPTISPVHAGGCGSTPTHPPSTNAGIASMRRRSFEFGFPCIARGSDRQRSRPTRCCSTRRERLCRAAAAATAPAGRLSQKCSETSRCTDLHSATRRACSCVSLSCTRRPMLCLMASS